MNESKHSTRFKGKTVFNSTTSRSMCWIKHLSLAILVTSLSGIKGQDVPSASVTPTFAPSVIDWTKPRQRKQMKDYFNRCNNLIENGDATMENDPTFKWDVLGSGEITVENGRFLHSGRTAVYHGPSQIIDPNCFTEGSRYEFIAEMNIQDKDGTMLMCNKRDTWGNLESCPLVMLKLEFENTGEQFVQLHNEITDDWRLNRPNSYKSAFVVTQGMATAKRVTLIINGPREGISIRYDNVSMLPFCKNLITGGDPDSLVTKKWNLWGATGFEVVSPGADGTASAYLVSGRKRANHGIQERLQTECFDIGTKLEFRVQVKLIDDETGEPFECDITAPMWNNNACVYFGVYIEDQDSKKTWAFKQNDAITEWKKDDWNLVVSGVDLTADIINSKMTTIHIMGPKPGIGIIFDQASLRESFEPDTNCNTQMVRNGGFENGSFLYWEGQGSGFLMIDSSKAFNSNYAVKVSNRRNRLDGIKQLLDVKCFLIIGKTIEISANVILLDDDGDLIVCDENLGSTGADSCPHFSFELTRFNGQKQFIDLERNGTNDEFKYSIENVFRISREFQWAKDVYLVIRGAAGQVSMIVDDVSITPLDKSGVCSQMVFNQKAQDGIGWEAYGTANILENSEGRSEDLVIAQRTHHSHGARQVLDISCLVREQRYKIEAQLELLDEEGNSFVCELNLNWGNPKYCPLFSIQLIKTGGVSWKYLQNESPYSWSDDGYNLYENIFTADVDLATAEKAYLYIYGPKAGVSIAMKNVKLEPYVAPENDCSEFVKNGNAENDNLDDWVVFGYGNIEIIDGGANSTSHSFKNSRRTSHSQGVKQEINVHCLIEGDRMEIDTFLKLKNGNSGFVCDKGERYGRPRACPLISIKFHVPSAQNGYIWHHIANEDPSEWDPDGFNHYRGHFEITSEMTTSTEAYLFIYGVRPGVDIMFDEVSITKYTFPLTTCSQLIRGGDAESGDLSSWSVNGRTSFLEIFNQGPEGSTKSFISKGRRSPSHGPEQELNAACLTVGKKYELTAQMKLVDGAANVPFPCDKTVQGDHVFMCPLVSLRSRVMGLYIIDNFHNDYAEQWHRNEFNIYHTIVTVTPDIAEASNVFLYLRGPKPDSSIIFDDIKLVEYVEKERDCNPIIKNGDAEEPTLEGWITGGSGFYEYRPDGRGGNIFRYKDRRFDHDGPRQKLDTRCFEPGKEYSFSAQIRLLYPDASFYFCDNAESERGDNFCVDFALELVYPSGKKWLRYLNQYPGEWHPRRFNEFRFSMTMTQQILSADEISFTLAGPPADVDILMDDVSFVEREPETHNCSEIVNGDAESGDFTGWSVFNRNGEMRITQPGADKSNKAFMHVNRNDFKDGVIQYVDLSCVEIGTMFDMTFKFKLVTADMQPVGCVKFTNDPTKRCVDVAMRIIKEDGSPVWVLFNNDDREEVVPGAYTLFQTHFRLTTIMKTARSIGLLLFGPPAGVNIIFDSFTLEQTQSESESESI